jgi:hypothetical protein
MDVSSTYTLEAMEKGHYVLSGSSELKSVESGEYQVINGMEMRYDLAGTSEASMTLGRENGWVLESSTSQKIKGHLKMKPNEQLPDGLDLPMSISTETAVSGK